MSSALDEYKQGASHRLLKFAGFLANGTTLYDYRHSNREWSDADNLINALNIKAGLISKEELEEMYKKGNIHEAQRAIHHGYALEDLDKEEEERKKNLKQNLNSKRNEIEAGYNEIEAKNFNMHFYRIMTSLLLFGVIDALDILSTAFDLMGGDFSESVKEIFGSKEIMGDLSEVYKTLKLDEVAGGLAKIPVFEDLNQFFVDTMSSEYLSPVTSVGGNILTSELAGLVLGAVLIANRGYQEYNLDQEATNLSQKEKDDIEAIKKNIKEVVKNAQIHSSIYEKKKFVDMEDIKTDLYWDKIDKEEDFARKFFKDVQDKLTAKSDKEYSSLSEEERKIESDRIKHLKKLKEILNDGGVDDSKKSELLKKYLSMQENHKDLIEVDKMMRADFFKHPDLIHQFFDKRAEYYQKKMISSAFSKGDEVDKAIKDIIRANDKSIENNEIDQQSKEKLKSENEFLLKYSNEMLDGDFVKDAVLSGGEERIASLDKVLKQVENGKIIKDIRTKTPPSTCRSPVASKLDGKDLYAGASSAGEGRG